MTWFKKLIRKPNGHFHVNIASVMGVMVRGGLKIPSLTSQT
jgi:hypothetical protein